MYVRMYICNIYIYISGLIYIYIILAGYPASLGRWREGGRERGREGGWVGKCSHVNVIEEFFICGL